MKFSLLAGVIIAASLSPVWVQAATVTTEDQQVGYALGYLTGKGNATHIPNLNVDMFTQGFKDAYSNKAPAMSEDQIKATLEKFRSKMMMEEKQRLEKESTTNKAAGDAFLAANAKKPGVKTLADGLQYEVVKEGKGHHPKPTDSVQVQYEGKLIDGKVFDSSYERKEPAKFVLDQVIPGWTEGLQLMTPGSVYRFYIPPALAYGENGEGPIPPNSVLVFKVELLKVEKPSAAN